MSTTYTIDTATSRANPTPAPLKRLTVPAIRRRKGGEPLVMLTAYTVRTAQLLDPHCDMLLVGDSLGQVIYGLPLWYRLDYAIATGTMLLGAVALLLRSRHAVALLTVSLVAVMIQFGWMFAMTDIIAVKGPYVLYFPLLILAFGALALHLAHLARRRGWIV